MAASDNWSYYCLLKIVSSLFFVGRDESVEVVPLISEIDTFVCAKLGTHKQKFQLRLNFNRINGKFQFLGFFALYKIMLFVIETVFEIESHTLLRYFFTEGYCLGKCRLSVLFTKVYSETPFNKRSYHTETSQLSLVKPVSIWCKFLLKGIFETNCNS